MNAIGGELKFRQVGAVTAKIASRLPTEREEFFQPPCIDIHPESSFNLDLRQPIFIVTIIPIIVTMRVAPPTVRAQQEALSALLLLS